MGSFIKQQLSREAIDESIDTTGVMEGVLSDVDSATSEATNQTNETTADEIDDVGNDIEAAQGYVDVLEQSPPEGASEEALAVAQVGLEAIFNKYGVPMKAVIARESADYSARVATFETIAMANEGIAEMMGSLFGSIKNVTDRIRVNMKDSLRYRTAWVKDAGALQKMLGAATGVPTDASYTNRIRVAHMTKGDKTVLTSGSEMVEVIKSADAGLEAMQNLLKGVGDLFTWFNDQKGKIDFDQMASQFEPSLYTNGMLSLTGQACMFGEESVVTPFGGKSDNAVEMMKIVRELKFKHTFVWKVKDLEQPALTPMSIADMKTGINDLIKSGQVICDAYNRRNKTMTEAIISLYWAFNPMHREAIHFLNSPINYIRFCWAYYRVLMAAELSIQQSFKTNFKAATCLLEYWKWSIANNK